jgi:hypothetical protein
MEKYVFRDEIETADFERDRGFKDERLQCRLHSTLFWLVTKLIADRVRDMDLRTGEYEGATNAPSVMQVSYDMSGETALDCFSHTSSDGAVPLLMALILSDHI